MSGTVTPFSRSDFWDGPCPKKDPQLSRVLTERSSQIADALGDILAEKEADKKLEKVLSLSSSLHTALTAVESAREGAQKKAFDGHPPTSLECEQLVTRLDDFARRLRLWLAVTLSSNAEALLENARERFTDAGDWARHYSIVRMTVTTFFIGIIFGVIGVKWDEFDSSLRVAMCFAWGIAVLFLGIFTIPESKKVNDQKELQFELPTLRMVSSHPTVSLRTRLLIWVPFFLMVTLSIPFGFLMKAWGDHTPIKKTGEVSVIEHRIEPPSKQGNIVPKPSP